MPLSPRPHRPPRGRRRRRHPRLRPNRPRPIRARATRRPARPPAAGRADRPEVLTPTTSLLDWKPVPGPIRRSVTRSVTDAGEWSLSVTGASAELTGPSGSSGVATSRTPGLRRPARRRRTPSSSCRTRPRSAPRSPGSPTLASGKTTTLDGRSDLPTTNGGTWALDGDTLVHATYAPRATTAWPRSTSPPATSTLGWCAPKRHGFSNAQVTPAGTSMLTFDDSQPACRTVVAVDGTDATPFTGVPDCTGWDGALLDDGAVWSVVPKGTAHRGRRVLRALRRRLLRPRSRHVGHPHLVRGRVVLRARPAARRRPGGR